MSRYPGQGRRPRRPAAPVDPVTALRDYAIRLHDKGDGRGVDWAKVAEACCRVAFSCLRELPEGDQGRGSVARRAHEAAYSLMTDAPDSGAPYMADRPGRPGFAPEATLHPEHHITR